MSRASDSRAQRLRREAQPASVDALFQTVM